MRESVQEDVGEFLVDHCFHRDRRAGFDDGCRAAGKAHPARPGRAGRRPGRQGDGQQLGFLRRADPAQDHVQEMGLRADPPEEPPGMDFPLVLR